RKGGHGQEPALTRRLRRLYGRQFFKRFSFACRLNGGSMFGKFAADVVTQLLDFPHQTGSDNPAAVVNGMFKLGDTQFDPAGVITGWPFSTRCRGWDGFGRGQIGRASCRERMWEQGGRAP